MSHQSRLSCEHCGDEATVVDDDGDFFMEQLDEWERAARPVRRARV